VRAWCARVCFCDFVLLCLREDPAGLIRLPDIHVDRRVKALHPHLCTSAESIMQSPHAPTCLRARMCVAACVRARPHARVRTRVCESERARARRGRRHARAHRGMRMRRVRSGHGSVGGTREYGAPHARPPRARGGHDPRRRLLHAPSTTQDTFTFTDMSRHSSGEPTDPLDAASRRGQKQHKWCPPGIRRSLVVERVASHRSIPLGGWARSLSRDSRARVA
jgi:hypothetical protein